MKNYFCVNRWVCNSPYYPHPSKEFEPALVQIDENLNFNVGDQIFLGLDLFKKLHEAAKGFIKRYYNVETVTFHEIKDMLTYVSDLNYLSIMFSTRREYPYDEKEAEQMIKEYGEDHNESDSTIDEEVANLEFLEDELYDFVIIKVFNVVYDLEKDIRVFELKIARIDY